MIRVVFLFFALISLTVWSNAQRLYVHDKLVRLEPLTDEHIEYLQALESNSTLDFWTEIIAPKKPVDVHLREKEFDQYISQFKQYSLPFNVIIDDVQESIDAEQQQIAQDRLMRQAQSRMLGQTKADILGTYVSYDEMVSYLDDQANADPTHIKVLHIGNTIESRSIKVISIKFNPSSTRNIWIDCGIHAREWITPAACMWMVGKMIQDYNNGDPTTKELLTHWTVHIAPSLNPDGYEFSRTSGNRLWRKNRSRNSGSSCAGTDLNRNYPWKWMTGGSSNNPCSETYAGRAAGSEIETVNVVNFLQSKNGTWDMYMSIHSYGQWWFTPYGYTTNLPNNYNAQLTAAQKGATAMEAVNRRKYVLGSVSNTLYVASGSTVDWAFDVLKIPFSNTIELPPTQSDSAGFILPPALAPGVCNETYIGMKVFLVEVKKQVTATSNG